MKRQTYSNPGRPFEGLRGSYPSHTVREIAEGLGVSRTAVTWFETPRKEKKFEKWVHGDFCDRQKLKLSRTDARVRQMACTLKGVDVARHSPSMLLIFLIVQQREN